MANKIHGHILLVVIVCVTVLSGVFTLVLKDNYKNSFFVTTFVKNTVDDKVSNMITDKGAGGSGSGVAGGLSKGKLGNVSKIEFDNEVDLRARFVPVSNESIYLRGFIGSIYEENSWKVLDRASNKKYEKLSAELNDVYGLDIKKRANFAYELLDNSTAGIFMVENVSANNEYPYMPYYAELNNKCMVAKNEDELYMSVNAHSYEMRYRPVTQVVESRIDNKNLNNAKVGETSLDTYYEYMKKIYTQLPKGNRKTLESICSMMQVTKKEQYTNQEINEIVDKIHSYLKKDYVYSTNCGSTPEGEDFVNYFVEKKIGFCAHYASLGTMILRYLGIPARYVEGYVISEDIINNGKIVTSDNVGRYLSSSVSYDKEVIEVEIPDNKAHAWVEVYKEDFGWVPYEMTVYSARSEGITEEETILGTNVKDIKNNLIMTSKKIVTTLITLVSVCLLLIVIALVRTIKIRSKRNRGFMDEDRSLAIFNLYTYLCNVMSYMGITRERGMTIDEYFNSVIKKGLVEKDILLNIGKKIKKAAYSNEGVIDEEYQYVKTQVENIAKMQYNSLSLKDKLKFKLIYNL